MNIIKYFSLRFMGWQILHSYRARNGTSAAVLDHFKFYFDINLDSGTGAKDISQKNYEP
jgi:hypothetical protein